MRNRSRWKTSVILSGLVLVIAIGGLSAIATVNARSNPAGPKHQAKQLNPNNNPFCSKLGKSVQASQGAQMFCFPPQPTGFAPATVNSPSSGNPYAPNVNAANPQEDVTPSGVSIHGQSETSIAAAGQYVVEAWNDGTGFFAPCGSPQSKDQLTGYGFSTDGGKSFRDLGGLPNNSCDSSVIAGDPSVEAYTVGGSTYFYISSIFIPFFVPENGMSITACQVVGSGSTATLACSQPIVAAISSDCQSFYGFTFCSFLDKEFLSIDPARNRLYMTYTEFGPSTGFSGVVELAVCDLSNPASPTCHNGSTGSQAPPYLVIAPGDPNFCENEGAYPAVDTQTGDVYVAYEHDWFSGLFNCGGETTQNVMNYVPFSCLTLTATSPCGGPAASAAVNITSMEAAFIPGYNRFPMNDFPRLAVSGPAGTVSMVWNDARLKPSGDIFMQSFNLGSLTRVQSSPVRINNASGGGGWQFLPAVRNADSQGKLTVSFYSRATPNTALTDVYASAQIDPRLTANAKGKETKITTGSTDWNAVSSIIVPNFGDYTDNYFTGGVLYVAWSDGRLGIPQPFADPLVIHHG
ncbi:MAG: hypothetical protein AUI21_06880 [Nitrospirae bacterium 13_1_40CM_2_62_10]|nr:MAG: hypothetical protein AUI21_06880 [Nitrospirae bacterium 13_1_40CM_2_62_10]